MDKVYSGLLSRLHKEVLKSQGFRKEGSNFRRFSVNGLGQIINFQKSSWNSGAECRFTMNIGIYAETGEKIQNVKFKEYECHLRTRADGVSLRYRGDQWWSILPGQDMDERFEELKTLMEEDVLPFLTKTSTRDGLRRQMQTGKFFVKKDCPL